MAVFRYPGNAVTDHGAGADAGNRLAVKHHQALNRRHNAAHQIGKQALAIARDAGNAENLTATNMK